MSRRIFWAASCAAAALSATQAFAAPVSPGNYKFAVSGAQTISFVLPASPTPSEVEAGDYFRINGVSGTVNSLPAVFDLGFGSSTYFFNFGFLNPTVGTDLLTTGSSLYTGTEAAPTFLTGTFALTPGYSVTITSGVPEPACWAMLLTGFGLMGAFVRRLKTTVRVSYSR